MLVLLTYYLILLLYVVIVMVIPGIGFIGLLKPNKEEFENRSVTIIIPFRNEIDSLEELCHSINKLDYPRDSFEVIFIDDDSSDNSLSILEELDSEIDYNLIQNSEHLGKKASILAAVDQAKFDTILTTDADCKLPKDLLKQVRPSDDISIGVALKTTDNWNVLENVQEAESLILAGITLGSTNMEIPMLASGANLAYKKSVIEETTPYENNMHIHSGDDMFLMKAGLDNESKIGARIGKPVITSCENKWNNYIEQSARWAGKNDDVGLPQVTVSAWLVLIANIILPLSLITHFSSGWIILIIKFFVDFLFLFLTATYYERFKVLLFAPVVFWFYPLHLVRVVIKIVNRRKNK